MELSLGMLVLILVLALLIFLFSGMHIAFALMAVGVLGLYFLLPYRIQEAAAFPAWDQVNSYSLTAVVLYVLMGELIVRGGISDAVFESFDTWLGKIPGGLLHSVIASCALFAAVSGSSVATAATMGTVAIPSMKKRKYNPELMYGAVVAGGTLGILIPPSVIMILYGALAGVSIAKCFFGGVIPGIFLAGLYMLYVYTRVKMSPGLAPAYQEEVTWKDLVFAFKGLAPVLLMVFIILGGIYMGVMTPTEAAAIGCLVAMVIIIVRRRMTFSLLSDCLKGTLHMSSMVFMIIAGAAIVSYVVHYLRIPILLIDWVKEMGLSPYWVLGAVCFIYYVLGCLIDGISICIITVPIVFPLMISIGFDPIWFGIILVINIEVSLITPPVGLNLYVIKGVDPESTFAQIIKGSAPYVVIDTIMILILVFFPKLVTWLPSLMFV